MKLVRFNFEGTNQRVWVLQHDLWSREGPMTPTRAVNLLTFVYEAHGHMLFPDKGKGLSQPCFALEAKLKAVAHFAEGITAAFARVPHPGADGRDIASFDAGTVVMGEVEAYLGAVYSSLELTNRIVRTLHPHVKQGFRTMAKKGFGCFTFERWPWLGSFYDVRTELCHFGSPIPAIDPAAVVLNITQRHETHRFAQGTQVAVPLAELQGYRDGLLSMLDEWALSELRSLDGAMTLRQLVFDARGFRRGVDVNRPLGKDKEKPGDDEERRMTARDRAARRSRQVVPSEEAAGSLSSPSSVARGCGTQVAEWKRHA